MLTGFKKRKLRKNRGNLYGAKKREEDGYKFDSTAEWRRYKRLKFELGNNIISNLEIHPSFELSLGGEEVCVYSADFSYINQKGKLVVEDVKSPDLMDSPVLMLKLRMLKAQHGIIVSLIHPDRSYREKICQEEDKELPS